MEYFQEQLKLIHEKQQIPLPKDAILGGQKMDLYKIYLAVTQQGGFHRVTNDRSWKKLSDSFNLSSTCTNSAYVFKQLYKKHLLVHELMQTRQLSMDEAIKNLDYDFEELGVKKWQPEQKIIYVEEQQTDERFLQGGWQNRISLALKSNLQNEVDWAFNKLIELSFKHNFYVGFIPTLPETLLCHCAAFFENLELNTSPLNFETSIKQDNSVVPELNEMTMFNLDHQQLLLERVLQVLHIIRNMSFMNENAVAFSRDHKLLTILAKSMALPLSSFCFYN